MNKKLIAVVVVVLLLLLGGGAYVMMNKSAAPAGTENTQSNAPTGGSAMKSLKDLMTSGVAQKCSYSDTNVSGTTFVSAGKIRTDFTTKSGETTVAGHMIVDGKVSWLWMDNQSTGFKMAFDPNEATNSQNAESNSQQGVDVNKAMDFKCNPEVANGSLFTPPKTVKFMDTGAAAVPTAPGATTPSAGSQCSACNYLTGDDKAQCLTALKCN